MTKKNKEIDEEEGENVRPVDEDPEVKYERERAEEEIQQKMGKIPKLKEVHETYRKWLHIEDLKRIDMGLALALTRKMRGTPVWIILVGPSGDFKSEQIMALDQDFSYRIDRLTSKTLISGLPKVEDLAPQFYAEYERMVLIPDMAQLLKLPVQEKAEVWAQLRNLYDGSLSQNFGSGKGKVFYDGLRITLLAGSTPHIDNQILIYQDLGTRELIYRTEAIRDYDALIKKVLMNENEEVKMREELYGITEKFLKFKTIKKKLLDEKIIDKLWRYIEFLTYMRAAADVDNFSGEVISDVSVEKPTRCFKQLKRLYVALMSLEEGYSEEQAFDVIKHIVLSSSSQNRCRVYRYLREIQERERQAQFKMSVYRVAEDLRLGKKTVFKELNILNNLGLIMHEVEELGYGKTKDTYYFDPEQCKVIENFKPLIVEREAAKNASISKSAKKTAEKVEEEIKDDVERALSDGEKELAKKGQEQLKVKKEESNEEKGLDSGKVENNEMKGGELAQSSKNE